MVTIRLPRNAWALLRETLTLDARSGAFEPKLRKQIAHALKQIREVAEPYILVTVKSGIPEASLFWDQEKAIKAAKREAKTLNVENDRAVVFHQGNEVFSWPHES